MFSEVSAYYASMAKNELYTTDTPEIFEHYLTFFPEGMNPIHRKRTVHDCTCCKQFVRRLGTLVNIVNGKITTVWDAPVPEEYKIVCQRMGDFVRSHKITGVFRSKEPQYSTDHNFDLVTHERYNHFWGKVAARHLSSTPGATMGVFRSTADVFRRGLQEININEIDDVLEMIASNELYRGEEYKAKIQGFRELLLGWDNTDLYIWGNIHSKFARFRSEVIGEMFAPGKPFEDRVRAFEKHVAPQNYKRPTAIITQSMVEKAIDKLTELGLHSCISRRYARLDDVSVNDVLFVDNTVRLRDSITDLLAVPKKLNRCGVEISAEQFVKDILPGAKSVEVFVENRHTGNFVSLTMGEPGLFKWNNGAAWSYDGDVTDSVKQRVKAAGGKIDCLLRVSLSWFNTDDLDLHAYTPDGTHIFFNNKMDILDVDMNAHSVVRNPVENLAFQQLKNGVYRIVVSQYKRRETTDVGFAIEYEYDGSTYSCSYGKSVVGDVECFEFHVKGGKIESVNSKLSGDKISKEKWGIRTESLVPVNAVMYSPNQWGGAVGAKHLIFALKDCRNPDKARGIYNEFLRGDLEQHRKVFEVLGAKTKCAYSEDQISGVGFTAARGDSVSVVVDKKGYTVRF